MSEFITQQVTRSHTIHLPATPHEVFPLFSPLGEKHWAHGWNPEMLYPSSGAAQVGTVFTTQHTNKPTQIWTIIAYASEQMPSRMLCNGELQKTRKLGLDWLECLLALCDYTTFGMASELSQRVARFSRK